MNDDAVSMLRRIYELLLLHQRSLVELMNATGALKAAVESDPKLLARYEKEYEVLANGPDARENQKLIAQLEETIRKLIIQ